MSGLRLSNLNKETTYLLTYLLSSSPDRSRRSAWLVVDTQVKACSRETHSSSRASQLGCCCCPAWHSVLCHCCPAWQTYMLYNIVVKVERLVLTN